MFYISTFWIPCFLMGFGIAIDVMIATIARFRDENLSLKNWTLPITATHVCLPAFGYYVFWGISVAEPAWRIGLGVFGFVFVLLFVYEVFCEAIGTEPIIGPSDSLSKWFSATKLGSVRFITIMAVSWDALMSGPAKASQAANQSWSTEEVFWSFFVAGLAVTVFAQIALRIALWLRKKDFHNAHSLAIFNIIGTFVELSVIGGFGLLSLFEGIGIESSIYQSIATIGVILLPIFCAFSMQLYENEIMEAGESIGA